MVNYCLQYRHFWLSIVNKQKEAYRKSHDDALVLNRGITEKVLFDLKDSQNDIRKYFRIN